MTTKEIEDPETLEALDTVGFGGTLTWSDLLSSQRLLIVSPAGAGKTFECQQQASQRFAAGEAAFFVTLEGLSGSELPDLLDQPQCRRLGEWMADGHSRACFFLDSIDELQLSHGNFRSALRRLRRAIDGQLHRASIVVTSRPIAIDLQAFASELPVEEPKPAPDVADTGDDRFRQLISGEMRREHHASTQRRDTHDPATGVRIVGLTSLSSDQIGQLIALQRVGDSARLLAEIDRKRAWEFAKRPQELIEICSYWKDHGRLGNRAEHLAEDIRRKLGETGGRTRHLRISEARALEGAERLALAQVLTRKRTIRFSDLSLDDLEREAAIDPSIILDDWSAPEREELLQRPLFGFASYGRVRFHHRSASEYLAARKLDRMSSEGHMPITALFRLLFGESYGQALVFPSMRAVAVWLAIRNNAVREEVLRREPEALMDEGDPECFSTAARERILSEYVRRYGGDAWRGVRIPYPQVLRFATPELSPVVRRLWETQAQSPEVRELLIDLIYAGRMHDCLDIADGVARDANATISDRVTAIAALGELTQADGLDPLIGEILAPDKRIPSQVKAGVLEALFPKHLSVPQFVTMLGQIEARKHSVGGVDWTLPRLVRNWTLASEQVTELRRALSGLIDGGFERSESWPHYTSRYRHYSTALATLCLLELRDARVPEPDLIASAVLASRLRENEYGNEKPTAELIARFHGAPRSWRAPVYRAEGGFCIAHLPGKNDEDFCYNLTSNALVGGLERDDFDWLMGICEDPATPRLTRASAFRDAMALTRPGSKPDESRLERLRAAASCEPAWTKRLDIWLRPRDRDPEWEAQERRWARQSAARKAKERRAIDSWAAWRDKVMRDPDAYFGKTANARIVQDFAHVLERDPVEGGWRASWNRATIAEHFSGEVADRVRVVFDTFWRTLCVPLGSERPEEERNTVWTNWVNALTGVYAAAEDPDWAAALSKEEAERAARLIPVEMDGVPPWTRDLATHKPEALDATLGAELSWQLAAAATFPFPALLGDFLRADETVRAFFAPRVWAWLTQGDLHFADDQEQARIHDHLDRAIDYRLQTGPNDDAELEALAIGKLAAGLGDPFALLWIAALFRTQPVRALDTLEAGLAQLDPQARYALSEGLFAAIGERRNARIAPDLSDPRLTVGQLLRLVRIAYSEIRQSDDIDRTGTGVFSPGLRDDAQQGRGSVLSALLAQTGPDAWAIKQSMRSDPLFVHFRDRLDQLAREKAAEEAEGAPLSDRDIASVVKQGEAPAADRNGMFQVMMDRLGDIRHDIAHHEFSERPILTRISREEDMQVWFAKRLQDRENGAYRVDREAMVVNAKETDIRLLSIKSNQQAVIELKLANNGYSVRDLDDALERQLVGQYMRHDNCRAGCLLITMAAPRTWRCPQTNVSLDFATILDRLRKRAEQIETEMAFALRLAVVGIDLSRPGNAT